MSNYVYSSKTNCFYPLSEKENYESKGLWDDEAVEVSDTIVDKYTGQPPEGKVRGADKNGTPRWVNVPPLTEEQQRSATDFKKSQLIAEADEVMLDWRTELMLDNITDDDREKLVKWMEYRKELKKVDVNNPKWPEKPE